MGVCATFNLDEAGEVVVHHRAKYTQESEELKVAPGEDGTVASQSATHMKMGARRYVITCMTYKLTAALLSSCKYCKQKSPF